MSSHASCWASESPVASSRVGNDKSSARSFPRFLPY
jgi:hypothetical protein